MHFAVTFTRTKGTEFIVSSTLFLEFTEISSITLYELGGGLLLDMGFAL